MSEKNNEDYVDEFIDDKDLFDFLIDFGLEVERSVNEIKSRKD